MIQLIKQPVCLGPEGPQVLSEPAALPEGARYACGGLGFLLGLAGAAACDRRVRRGRTISYQITRKL